MKKQLSETIFSNKRVKIKEMIGKERLSELKYENFIASTREHFEREM
jgi:hypothetical protein